MPRPTRSPQGKAVRLTIYVEPDTKRLLVEHAAATHSSPGEVIDKIVADVADDLVPPFAPRASDARASLPSLAGQPGVEHRATAVLPTAAVARDDTFYDHPGWKLSATGQNICTRCGKTKLRSKNASCKAPA